MFFSQAPELRIAPDTNLSTETGLIQIIVLVPTRKGKIEKIGSLFYGGFLIPAIYKNKLGLSWAKLSSNWN